MGEVSPRTIWAAAERHLHDPARAQAAEDTVAFLRALGQSDNATSGDVNAYLREISGTDITAKDFRTWTGTVLAATSPRACPPRSRPWRRSRWR